MSAKEIVYNTVKMHDGRLVDFAPKRNVLKGSIADSEGNVGVHFDFSNGETRDFWIPQSLLTKFATHGAMQKLGDEFAGLQDIDDIVMAFDALASRLEDGEWTAKRESSGMAGASVLCKALIEHTGKSPQVIKAYLETKSQQEKMALRANKAIAPIIAKLEAAKVKKVSNVDTEALLDELA